MKAYKILFCLVKRSKELISGDNEPEKNFRDNNLYHFVHWGYGSFVSLYMDGANCFKAAS